MKSTIEPASVAPKTLRIFVGIALVLLCRLLVTFQIVASERAASRSEWMLIIAVLGTRSQHLINSSSNQNWCLTSSILNKASLVSLDVGIIRISSNSSSVIHGRLLSFFACVNISFKYYLHSKSASLNFFSRMGADRSHHFIESFHTLGYWSALVNAMTAYCQICCFPNFYCRVTSVFS